jgi:[acyl-carrier-protein] S-malonyltransferase
VSLALLFSGQGTQHADMLPWLESCPEAAPTLALLATQLGDDWRARLTEPEWAQRNAVAQPLLTGLSLAAWQALAPRLPVPAVVAGYSLGELAAFSVAGVFSVADAMTLSTARAAAMDRSAGEFDTGLMSVQGFGAPALLAACAHHGLSVAIRIAPDRVVLGGLSEALKWAEPGLTASGARCTVLAVRVASHTAWMSAAAAEFEARLGSVPLVRAASVLVCNHSGATEREPSRLRQLLARQIATPVRWDGCMDAVAERRVRCVLEVGAGQALTLMWRERHPDIPVRSVDEFRSPQAIARWVETVLR